MPLPVPSDVPTERSRIISGEFMRLRALERLYKRIAAVDALIESLEVYERTMQHGSGECIPFMAPAKCL
jgi:hypothetical protein